MTYGRSVDEEFLPVQYQRLLGTKTGIIKEVFARLPERSGPEMSVTEPAVTDHSLLPGSGYGSSINASGKARSFRRSLVRAIGETIERYCIRFPPTEEFLESSYVELDDRDDANVVDFDYIDRLEIPEESEYAAPTRTMNIDWVSGIDLLTGDAVYVPADMIYFTSAEREGEQNHLPTTTNGVAAGPSMEEAVLGAIYEAVERDGLMRTWWLQKTPRRIDVSDVPEVDEELRQIFDHSSKSCYFTKLDMEVDVPAVAGMVVNERDEYPKFLLAGHAEATWREAVIGAGVELAQCVMYMYDLVKEKMDFSLDDPIDNLTDNTIMYARPEMYDKVEFLTGEGSDPIPLGELERRDAPDTTSDELAHCLREFEAAGLTPIAFDLTTEDVRDVGISAARVFVPELVPLDLPTLPPSRHPEIDEEECTDLPHPIP